jgi:hypothetical protein
MALQKAMAMSSLLAITALMLSVRSRQIRAARVPSSKPDAYQPQRLSL